jgi:hypothetical protein
MSDWNYQIRVHLSDASAEAARRGETDPALAAMLARHRATLVSQYDAFADYVAQAEREGPEHFPLYRWTKATIDDPAKRAKHIPVFALRIAGAEVYPGPAADALEADLRAFVGGAVERITRHDTNPATSIPVPEEFRSPAAGSASASP